MHSRCNGLLLLGAVILSVATMTSVTTMKKPLGPKLCEHFCNRIVGCKYYIYRISDLFCYLTNVTLQNQENGIYSIKATKDKERMHIENAINCSEGDQIIRTRGHGIICRPILPNLPTNKEDVADGRLTKILILNHAPPQHLLGRQLYLANNSVVTHHFLYGREYEGIAYIPSQRKLVMSTKRPYKIVFMSIDAKSETVVRIKSLINGIAIDDEKQLIFMKNIIPTFFVGVMKTHDKKQKMLFDKIQSCQLGFKGGIVADHKRSLIYLRCYNSEIQQFTYQGIPKGRVADIENAGRNPFYLQEDSLYYQTKSESVKISLSDHSVTKLPTLNAISSLLKFGNLLYMLPEGYHDKILVVNMSDMSTVTSLKMGFGLGVHCFMCLI